MNNERTTTIVPHMDNTALVTTPQHMSLRQIFKCVLFVVATLAIGQVYADYTVTYQYTEPVVAQEFDRWEGKFDYTFEEKTYTAPTYYSGFSGFSGIRMTEYSFSHSSRPNWVESLRVDGGFYGTRTLHGVISGSTLPRDSFSIQPHVTAIIGENPTSSERICIITNTLTAKSYSFNSTQAITSYFHWYCVIKQAAGSKTVTVTLDSNGGTDALPKNVYKYANVSSYNQYSDGWIWPTTTRAGFVFDAWYTYSPDFPEVHNVRIDENTKTTARVTTIVAHWLFDAPHNFTATSNLTDRISLSWEPVASLNATYGIYRSEDGECPATPIWAGDAQTYDDTSADSGKNYYYWVKASGVDRGLTISSANCEPIIGMRAMEQVAAPTITPADGTMFAESSKTVSLECATQEAFIYYTIDGTMPDENSSLYTTPFDIVASTTIKAIANKDGMRASEVAVATITKVQPLSLNDALDTDLTISTGGVAEWMGVRNSSAAVGNGYAKSGAVGDRQSTWLSVTVSGKGVFSFWWRVSCEGTGEYDCDLAMFSASDADVPEIKRDGIMSEWEKITVAFNTAGDHVLTWTYKKDKSYEEGDDCLYLDEFSWSPAAPTCTETTPVPVRRDWLAKYPGILAAADNDYEAAAMRPTGKKDAKGNALSVWHDYVAGTDPTNINSRFAAKVSFKGGKPVVSWEPDLNDGGAKSERFYKVFGKRSLSQSENWTRLADADATDGYSFFKVSVGMEESEDTEDDLAFGNGKGHNGESGAESDVGGNDSGAGEDEAYVPPIVTTSAGSSWVYVYGTAVASAIGYEVYRAEENEAVAATMIAYVESKGAGIGCWYMDSSVVCGKMYYYWIKTVYASGKSDFSEGVSGGAEPPAPQNISASLNRTDGVEITWDVVEVADAYNVYRDEELIGSTTDTRWLDTTVQAGYVLYSYDVKSVSATGETSGRRFIYGRREQSIASLVMTGTDEVTIDPQCGATLSFQCEATYIDGTTETISPDSWDWSEFSGEIWRESGVIYVRLGNGFPSMNLTMRATYTSNAGGNNPTVYNLSHTVIVHSAQ